MNKFFFVAALLAISSCRLVPNRMFKTPPGFTYAQDSLKDSRGPYVIQSNDKFELHIFSNDGFKLVDITQSNMSTTASSEGIVYEVQANGEAKLPVIGWISLKGSNIKDA